MPKVVTRRGSRVGLVAVPASQGLSWSDATAAFLAGRDLSQGTRRVYGLTLNRLGERLGSASALDALEPLTLAGATNGLWVQASPAGWNRHLATIASFLRFAERQGWLPPSRTEELLRPMERRRVPEDRSRALSEAEVMRLLRLRRAPARERCLWALLYSTAARAEEILCLNVEDLDLANRRAPVHRKGSDIDVVFWDSLPAQRLPEVIAGRNQGPVFLSERQPQSRHAVAAADICPETGRARLSYRRAEELFHDYSNGRTLHQLRHSRLSHLADANVSTSLLMAKSGHRNLRSLQRYARPGADAVAAMTAAHDPAARRR